MGVNSADGIPEVTKVKSPFPVEIGSHKESLSKSGVRSKAVLVVTCKLSDPAGQRPDRLSMLIFHRFLKVLDQGLGHSGGTVEGQWRDILVQRSTPKTRGPKVTSVPPRPDAWPLA